MNSTSIASSITLGLFLSLPLNAPAGFNSARAGDSLTALPLGQVNAVPFGRSFPDTLQAHYDAVNSPLPPNELAILKQNPPFNLLSDADAQLRMAVIRRAVLDAVFLLSLDDPCLGDSLLQMYRNRRIGLGFGGCWGLRAQIREDGSAEVGDEAINLYDFPRRGTPVYLYDCELVELVVILGHLGQVALGAGYTGPQPTTVQLQANWALANQRRETNALSGDLDRINALLAVLESLTNNLTLPVTAKGSAWQIGFAILSDPSLTDAGRRRVAFELWELLTGDLKPRTEQLLAYRQVYGQMLAYILAGQITPVDSYNELMKKTGFFFDCWRPKAGEFSRVALRGGGGSFMTSPSLQYVGEKTLWQRGVSSNGLQQEFSLDVSLHFDFLSDAKRWDNTLFVAGDRAGSQDGALRVYLNPSGNGIFDATTGYELVRDTRLSGGFKLGWNRSTSNLMAFSRDRRLYEFTGKDSNGFPTSLELRGSLDLRADLSYFSLARDGTWAFASPDRDLSLGRHSHTGTAYWNLTGFSPYRLADDFKETTLQAALGRALAPGGDRLYATATPGYFCLAMEVLSGRVLGTAQADPAGHMVFSLGSTLQAGQQIKVGSSLYGWSPTYTVPDSAQPRLFVPRQVPKSRLQIESYGQQRWATTFRRSADLLTWQDGLPFDSSRYGNSFLKATAGDMPQFFRTRQDAPALANGPHDFQTTPGAFQGYHLGYDDPAPSNTTYQVVPPSNLDSQRFHFFSSGSFSFLPLAFESAVSFQYQTYSGGQTSLPTTVTINVNVADLFYPPVERDTNGVDVVPVECLVLDVTNHCPIFQFVLDAADVCTSPHWHCLGGAQTPVYPLESPLAGKLDPNPTACGFGTQGQVLQATVRVPFTTYRNFLSLH
jgi:hypothetical protein